MKKTLVNQRYNSSVNDDLKNLSIPELKKKPGSSPEGFTQEEAKKRLDKYGPNEIVEKKTNQFLKFLSYFWDPIPWMIESCSISFSNSPALAGFWYNTA